MPQFFKECLAWYCLTCVDAKHAEFGLAAEDMTDLMIWEVFKIAPLLGALLVPSERGKWHPARLHALGLLRYDALL